MNNNYPSDYVIYKPNKKESGTASSWKLGYNNNKGTYDVFLKVSNQKSGKDAKGNFQFDWDNATIVKLNSEELAEIIRVFTGKQKSVGSKGAGFYHTSNVGTRTINISKSDTGDGFFINIKAYDTSGNAQGSFGNKISEPESVVLVTLLRTAIQRMFNW